MAISILNVYTEHKVKEFGLPPFLDQFKRVTKHADSSNGRHSGPFFKPEKNLEFFRQKIGP